MALQKCHECGNDISSQASACPKCGAPNNVSSKSGGWLKWLLITPFGLIALVMVIGSLAPTPGAKANARDAIQLCWSEHDKKSQDPGAKLFIASTCERMEREFREKFGSSP